MSRLGCKPVKPPMRRKIDSRAKMGDQLHARTRYLACIWVLLEPRQLGSVP